MKRRKTYSKTLKGGFVLSKKIVGVDLIEVLKMLRCRVRLYIDKLFEPMLNPGTLMLLLKMLEQQVKYRV